MEENHGKKLKTVAGAPVADSQNTLAAVTRASTMLQDVCFWAKFAHFVGRAYLKDGMQPSSIKFSSVIFKGGD